MRKHKKQSIHFYSVILTVFFTFGIPLSGAAPDIPGLPDGIDSGASNAYTTADGVTFEADYGRTGSIKIFAIEPN